MAGFLLDTNHLSDALRPVSRVRDRIGQLRHVGARVGTCIPVLCELEAALPSGERGGAYRRALLRLLGRVRVWPLEREAAHRYGEIYRELRKLGRVLSQVDIMLAALARQMDLTIATTDGDFEALPDIRTENWLFGKS
jgi:predicted nucleic acid-binding protein